MSSQGTFPSPLWSPAIVSIIILHCKSWKHHCCFSRVWQLMHQLLMQLPQKIDKYITSVDLNSFKAGLWLEKVIEVGMCCLRKINLPPLDIWYLHNLTHLFLIVGSERWLGLHNHYTPERSMILVWEVTNQSLNLQLVTTCSGVLTQRRNILSYWEDILQFHWLLKMLLFTA